MDQESLFKFNLDFCYFYGYFRYKKALNGRGEIDNSFYMRRDYIAYKRKII